MYTISALWTHAREGLDVTTVIFSNRSYAILAMELDRVGAAARPGTAARSLLDLSRPGAGLHRPGGRHGGARASRAGTAAELAAAAAAGPGRAGPAPHRGRAAVTAGLP